MLTVLKSGLVEGGFIVNQLVYIYNTFCKAFDDGKEVRAIFSILERLSIECSTEVFYTNFKPFELLGLFCCHLPTICITESKAYWNFWFDDDFGGCSSIFYSWSSPVSCLHSLGHQLIY